MSLFSKLLQLSGDSKSSLEDFHTEIVAQVLQDTPELTVRWLADLGLTAREPPDTLTVGTQQELDALDAHEGLGSRPDIWILLTRGDLKELVFLESKVGSTEGWKQLQRYADQLAARKEVSKGSLVYITRDFEPKERPQGLALFRQVRWYDFYRFAKAQPQQSDLLKQLRVFIGECNISQTNQFTM